LPATLTVLFLLTAPASLQAEEDAAAKDKPIATYQGKLLEMAFNAVTAMPLNPHLKNRSREQGKVVEACLELDQPQRALAWIEEIGNWRRGLGYARLAFHLAQRDRKADVKWYLARALEIAEKYLKDPTAQAWRADRIRVKVAETYVLLGKEDKAVRLEAGFVDSETGKVAAVRAMLGGQEEFDRQMKALDGIFEVATLDRAMNAMETYVQLYKRFYADEEKRKQVKERIMASLKKVPLSVAIDVLMKLGDCALEHGDQARSRALADEVEKLMESVKWVPEHKIPVMARLAVLRYRAGGRVEANKGLEAALALFDAEREKIVSMWRAGALRPVAEAYKAMGNEMKSLAIYKKAVEDGAENPNARPRAMDLSATCISMALNEVEPDADLWCLMAQIFDELNDPW
jgi:tetratricopeptide (TPR) repeat protein